MASEKYEFTGQDVKLVREWLVKMPHLVHDYDDTILKALITACKGSFQRFKESFEKLNSLGFQYPHLFGHLDPLNEITQYYLNNKYLFLMPEKTDDDCYLLITTCRITDLDFTKFSIFEMARYIFMSFMVLLWENNLGASKFILIYDCKNERLAEFKTVTPVFLRDIITCIRKLPIRFQGGHHVNVPHFVESILNFTKSILPTKLSERIHFHSSMDELHKIFPRKLLPDEFGGCAGDLDTLHNTWKKKIESYRDRLILENSKMRKLDHLRPKANINGELQGFFRKLEVD